MEQLVLVIVTHGDVTRGIQTFSVSRLDLSTYIQLQKSSKDFTNATPDVGTLHNIDNCYWPCVHTDFTDQILQCLRQNDSRIVRKKQGDVFLLGVVGESSKHVLSLIS